jgi:putative transposase
MQRKVAFIGGEYYHLYNRGVDKRAIFSSTSDYRRFMMLLYLSNSAEDVRISNVLKTHAYEDVFVRERKFPLVAIGAYCLMPNHFHILATPLVENGISRYMLKVQTGYSMYFNTKNDRTGSLFQGPFKSEHADDDRYLKYLFSYIHLNPAKLKDPHWKEKIGMTRNLSPRTYIETYPFGSLKEYLSGTYSIINPKPFPDYFSTKKDLVEHITDWLGEERLK